MQELAHGHALSNLAAPSLIRSDGAETGRTPTKRKMLKRTPSKGGKEGAVPFIATSCEDRVGIVGGEKRTHSGSYRGRHPRVEPLLLPLISRTVTSEAKRDQNMKCCVSSREEAQPALSSPKLKGNTLSSHLGLFTVMCIHFKNSVTQKRTPPSNGLMNEEVCGAPACPLPSDGRRDSQMA